VSGVPPQNYIAIRGNVASATKHNPTVVRIEVAEVVDIVVVATRCREANIVAPFVAVGVVALHLHGAEQTE
jgi:hypothetical protein